MINIAIDGPAGAGKSTIAKAVAKELDCIYLDTGAMYRATAYYALEQGISVSDAQAVEKMLENVVMDIKFEDGAQQIYVNGINTTPYLREHYMSKAASDISALPCVRYKMVDLQREFAKSHDVVLDGRDIGTFVLPDANCKFYMTATAEERATRRYKELIQKGQQVDYDTLLEDIKQRDYNDSHREVAPLKQADDATYVDTTVMSIDEVVSYVKAEVLKKMNDSVKVASDAKEEEKAEQKESVKAEVKADEPQKADGAKEKKDISRSFKPETTFRLYRFLKAVLRPIQAIILPTKVINKENMKKVEGAALVTCNHYSKFDAFIPCFTMFKREAHILAKYELFQKPFVGWLFTKMGAIPVHRGDADIEAVKSVLKVLRSDKKLLIFPEGTRNKEGTQQMAEFKDGTARFAIKTKSPVIPMMYYSSPKLFKKNWLYVGEPFTLEQFYGARTSEEYKAATEYIFEKMQEARRLCNEIAEKRGKNKKKAK